MTNQSLIAVPQSGMLEVTPTNPMLPVLTPEEAGLNERYVLDLMSNGVLKEGAHYGKLGENDKARMLFKPGAEIIARGMGYVIQLDPKKEVLDFDKEDPFIFYEYSGAAFRAGLKVAVGFASCNSREKKYGKRWVLYEQLTPKQKAMADEGLLPVESRTLREYEWAITKGETTGKYGKPESYWKDFRDAIANKTARKKISDRVDRNGEKQVMWEIGGDMYGTPNTEIYDLINTISAMAQKRTYVTTLVRATGIGGLFVNGEALTKWIDAYGDDPDEWGEGQEFIISVSRDVTDEKKMDAQAAKIAELEKKLAEREIKTPFDAVSAKWEFVERNVIEPTQGQVDTMKMSDESIGKIVGDALIEGNGGKLPTPAQTKERLDEALEATVKKLGGQVRKSTTAHDDDDEKQPEPPKKKVTLQQAQTEWSTALRAVASLGKPDILKEANKKAQVADRQNVSAILEKANYLQELYKANAPKAPAKSKK